MSESYDVTYDGWAPCIHTDEEQIAAKKWVNDRKLELLHDGCPLHDFDPLCGGVIETVMWHLNFWNVEFHCYADQWVGIHSTGKIEDTDKTAKVFIQADSFLLGLLETWRWWRNEGGKRNE